MPPEKYSRYHPRTALVSFLSSQRPFHVPLGYPQKNGLKRCSTGKKNSQILFSLASFLLMSSYSCNRMSRAHLLSATVRVYSLVAPCCLPDLTSLALLGSVSGQRGLSRGPLPGYKTVSKWRLQLQDSTPFLLLSQRFCTTLHTSASLGCYLLFTHMPDCPLAPLGQV